MQYTTHMHVYPSTVEVLTRSSAAVRWGVRVGAWGVPGSLPRFNGNGSASRPLQISSRVDILTASYRSLLQPHCPPEGEWSWFYLTGNGRAGGDVLIGC